MKIELKNPLNPGFYESSVLNPGKKGNGVECSIYEADDIELDNYLSKNNMKLKYDYQEYQKLVSEAVNDYFIEKINDLIYELFDIPDLFRDKRNDNFETEKSYFDVTADRYKYESFIKQVFSKYYKELDEMIRSRHTSNNIDAWKAKKYNLDYNELETVFLTLFDLKGEDMIYDLYDICSEIYFEIERWYEDLEGNKFYFQDLQEKISNQKID